MTDLVIVRHAQSVWNAESRWQGWADPPLSPHGEQQAADAGRALGATTDRFAAPDLVVASDLRRARQTAVLLTNGLGPDRARREIVSSADSVGAADTGAGRQGAGHQGVGHQGAGHQGVGHGGLPSVEIRLEPDLREYDVGDWTGLKRSEIAARWPQELVDWDAGRLDRAPGGEDRAVFVGRLFAALERIRRTIPTGRVLAVSHGRALHALADALGGSSGHIDHLTGWRLHLGTAPVLVSAVSLLDTRAEAGSDNGQDREI